jgi:NADH:ubiquinone oxidoreductase subunit 4 (subunit M)
VLDELEAMRLNKALPFAAVTFVVAGLASMGMPGFSGFVAELQVLIGAWKAFPTFAVLGGLGVVIGVVYTLRAMQKAFFSGDPEPEYTLSARTAHPHPVRNERGEGRGEGHPFADTSAQLEAERPSSPQPSPASEGGEGEEYRLPGTHSGGEGARRAGEGAGSAGEHGFDAISIPERIGAALLIATTLLIGLCPRLLLDLIVPALNSTLFDALRKSAAP